MTPWLKQHRPLYPPKHVKRAPLGAINMNKINHPELLQILNDPLRKPMILDVRDDDAKGGHIRGALHFPESLWQDSFIDNGSVVGNYLLQVLYLIKDEKPDIVIIHCMESAVRGPHCVHLLKSYCKTVPVVLLQGGADQFVRKFYKTDYVVDYDNDIWGFDM
jgi:rhodanese-related sulfurtransferase